jgi:hypothetical protein
MTTERLEPFRQALVELRRRLRDGALAPGARVTVKEVADGQAEPHPRTSVSVQVLGEGWEPAII